MFVGKAICVFSLVIFSMNELSFRQTAVKNVLHLLLLQAAILPVLYLRGLITSVSMAVALAISIHHRSDGEPDPVDQLTTAPRKSSMQR